ncbi:MAG: hypothetical protein V1856_02665 [Candidatus Liptonbacteria bacterium]
MILSIHVLGGAAAASLAPNWLVSLLFSFFSHFLLDAIPHWHYPTYSERANLRNGFKELVSLAYRPDRWARHPLGRDAFSAGLDLLLGLAILGGCLLYSESRSPLLLVLSGVVGVLPDFATLLFILFPQNNFLAGFRLIHKNLHARTRLDDRYFEGISSQLAIALILIWLLI